MRKTPETEKATCLSTGGPALNNNDHHDDHDQEDHVLMNTKSTTETGISFTRKIYDKVL